MTQYILDSLTDVTDLGLNTILLNNVAAVIISLFVMLSYKITYSGTAYSRRFNISIGMIVLIITMIMCVISNNIALSLGLVGALSVIRFRAPIKDVRDACFLFWGIGIGICCGVAQYILPAISSGFILLFLLVFKGVKSEKNILLIARCTADTQNSVAAVILQHFKGDIHLKIKSADTESCEMIYEIGSAALKREQKANQTDIVQKLTGINGVQHVSLAEQTDDLTR